MKVQYPFNRVQTYLFNVFALLILLYSSALTANATPIAPPCTTPSPATGFTAGTPTSTTAPGSFTASIGGATGYLVLYNTTGTAPTAPTKGTTYPVGNTSLGATVASSSGTTFTPTGLTANTKYYFFIYSYNSATCSGGPKYSTTSLTGNITTCAGAPTMGAATGITSSGFTANWTAPTGGSAGTITYTIDVSLTTSFGSGNDISGYPVSGITGLLNVVSGLSSNTTYYYQVTATNGTCGTTAAYINTKTSLPPCTTPSVPTGFTAGTQTSTTAPGSFTAPGGGATGYIVLYNTTGIAPTAPTNGTTYPVGNTSLGATVASSSGTAFTPTGLTANTKYYFFIFSYNNTSCSGGPVYSATSLTGNITTCAGAPTMGAATGVTSSGFTANWTAPTGGSAGAITYTIDVSLTTSFGSGNDISGYPVSGITGLLNVVSGLSSNTTYYYQVTATNGTCGTTAAYTNTKTSLPPCTTPLAPTVFTAGTQTSTTAPGSFTAPGGGVTGYIVLYNTTGIAPTAPTNGTTYPVGNTSLGATVASSSGTAFTPTGLTANTKYYFFIFSYNNTSCSGGPVYSATSLTGNITTCAGAPTMGAATGVTSSGFTANWTAPTGGSAGAITYTIDVSLTTSFGSGNDISGYPVSGITGLLNVVSGLSSNTTYYYQVTATNGTCGTTAAYTNTKTSLPPCTTPLAPTVFTAGTQTSTTAPGSFTAPGGGATGYIVLYNTTGTVPTAPTNGTTYPVGNTSLGATVASSSGTAFTPTGLTANTKYYFFIFSYNNTSCSGGPAYSATSLTGNITTCAGAPTMGAATGVTSSGFTANWTAPTGGSAGAITYTIDVSLTTSFGSGNDISGYPVSGITGLSNVLSGLSSNTTYYYQVTATNGICGTTAAYTSTTTSMAPCTTPSPPTALVLTPGVVSIVGSFTAPGTAPTGYLVIRTTSSTAPSTPITGTTYTAGSSALGGYIVSNGTTASFTDNGLSASIQYWYWVYSYNSTTCTGGAQYSTTNLNGNAITSAICGGTYSIYALDNQGYIYPVNTSTAVLQTPLNNTVGPVTGTSNPNAIGYSSGSSKFYYISKTNAGNSTFTSYDGASAYATLSPFTGSGYPVTGASTADGLGFYSIDYKTGDLWYYLISSGAWTMVTTAIMNGATNLSTQISSNETSGDLVEDGYGSLWLLMSGGTTYGLYVIATPPTTLVASVTTTQVISYTTALPLAAGDTWGGAAFDAAGNLWLSSRYKLYEIINGSTTPALVGTFSGFVGSGTEVTDLAQCTYPSNPLPLVWLSFNATLNNNNVDVDWDIAQASLVKGFYVERSSDSKNWDTLGFVQYINGNLDYLFTDASPVPGTNYYRIAESDYDNKSNYSIIRTVTLPILSNISIWPNPANDFVHIQYNGSANNMTAMIFDELGRNLSTTTIYQGSNTISLSKMPPGIYFVLVEGTNKESFYKKIIKERD